MQWIQVEPAIHGQREIHLNYKPKAVSSGSVASMNLQESVVSAFCSTAWRELVLRAQKFCQTLPLKQYRCNYFKLCPSSSLIQTSRQLPNDYLLAGLRQSTLFLFSITIGHLYLFILKMHFSCGLQPQFLLYTYCSQLVPKMTYSFSYLQSVMADVCWILSRKTKRSKQTKNQNSTDRITE